MIALSSPNFRRSAIAIIVAALLLLFVPLVASNFVVHVLVASFYYVILAASWNLLAGYTGQFSLAHHAFAAVGAYTSGLLGYHWGISVWIGIPAGGAAGHAGAGAAGGHATASAGHAAVPTHTSFNSHPAPAGSHEAHTANGSVVRTRANGTRSDIHDAKRGIDVHRGLDGRSHSVHERPDHSRVFAEHGRGYVQHPYRFHGHEFGHRTYWDHGRYHDGFYRRYGWGGAYYDLYAPVRFYPVGFYAWGFNPWLTPVPYVWGWAGNPWYASYGWYFTPYPTYAGPAFWLADYMIAAELRAQYEANAEAAAAVAEADRPPPLAPAVKDLIAEEVRRQLEIEKAEAAANAAGTELPEGQGSVASLLADGRTHVFVVGQGVDGVDMGTGAECLLSNGDVIQVAGPLREGTTSANVGVLSSKGGVECHRDANVTVSIADLQGVYNHVRETVGAGLEEMKTKAGTGGIPQPPADARGAAVQAAFAVGAPPPDTTAQAEIEKQAGDADAADKELASASLVPDDNGVPADGGGAPPTVTLGQSVPEVKGILGEPKSVMDLGPKKIFVYPDMKIYFQEGRVVDVK